MFSAKPYRQEQRLRLVPVFGRHRKAATARQATEAWLRQRKSTHTKALSIPRISSSLPRQGGTNHPCPRIRCQKALPISPLCRKPARERRIADSFPRTPPTPFPPLCSNCPPHNRKAKPLCFLSLFSCHFYSFDFNSLSFTLARKMFTFTFSSLICIISAISLIEKPCQSFNIRHCRIFSPKRLVR